MSSKEKGFLDELIEGICNDIEIKGVIEASRDENGKVDKWIATGIAMGLGHTSDDEMATLAGFLGAEGAFDESDEDTDIDLDCDIPVDPIIHSTMSDTKETRTQPMAFEQYEMKCKSICLGHNLIIGAAIFGIVLFTIALLYACGQYPDGAVVYTVMLIVIDASLGYAICNSNAIKGRELSKLLQEYRKSQEDNK